MNTFLRPMLADSEPVHHLPAGWLSRVACRASRPVGAYWEDAVMKSPRYLIAEIEGGALRCSSVWALVTCDDCKATAPVRISKSAAEAALHALGDHPVAAEIQDALDRAKADQ
jgi:hypothetical protein